MFAVTGTNNSAKQVSVNRWNNMVLGVPLPPEAFGAIGDGTTDDSVALQAWLDYGGNLYLPAKEYYSSVKLIVRKCVHLNGATYGFDNRIVGYDNMPGSKIRFPAGVAGLDIQGQTTLTDPAAVVAAGAGAWTQEGAYGSVIRNIALIGPDTGAATTGLYCRTFVHLDNIHVINFQGKGFDISASAVVDGETAGYAEYGNASSSSLRNCHANSNGSHGFHVRGYDANTILFDNCSAATNGGIGFFDESLIGNTYLKPHTAGNAGHGIKAVRSHTNHFIHPYMEGGGSMEVSGSNVFVGSDSGNVSTQKPIAWVNGYQRVHQLEFHWGWESPGAITDKGLAFHGDTTGLTFQAHGGTSDYTFLNKSGTTVASVPTNTTNWNVVGDYYRNGTKVVGAQQGAIADVPTGGSATAAANATAINAILAAWRAHGGIAT